MDTLCQTGGQVLKMVHTHEGAAATCMLLAYGMARDRKRLVRGMKGTAAAGLVSPLSPRCRTGIHSSRVPCWATGHDRVVFSAFSCVLARLRSLTWPKASGPCTLDHWCLGVCGGVCSSRPSQVTIRLPAMQRMSAACVEMLCTVHMQEPKRSMSPFHVSCCFSLVYTACCCLQCWRALGDDNFTGVLRVLARTLTSDETC